MDVIRKPVVVKLKIKDRKIVQDCDVYIGRAQNQGGWKLKKSIWHNQYTTKVYGDDCIRLYKKDLYEKIKNDPETWIDLLVNLEGKTLGCWCKPEPCHGDVIADLVVKVCQAENDDKVATELMNEIWG